MTDECRFCVFSGDYDSCITADCNDHDSWYVKELKAQAHEARVKQEGLEDALKETTDKIKAMALMYGEILPQRDIDRYNAMIEGIDAFKDQAN